VSCGVFSISLKLRPEIYDEFSQTKYRPRAPEIIYLRGFELPRCLTIHWESLSASLADFAR